MMRCRVCWSPWVRIRGTIQRRHKMYTLYKCMICGYAWKEKNKSERRERG